MSEVCKTFYVTGVVQGVSFRYYTQHKARELELRGWVRNVITGAVEILAVGKNEEMLEFETWLQHGPSQARVKTVESKVWETPPDEYDFIVDETGEARCWAK